MDAKDAVKKYWPWMLGGVVGLYLLSRNSGSSSGGTVVMGYSDAAYAAQAQIAAVNAQTQLQSEAAAREHALNLAALEAQTKTANDANLAAYIAAQGTAAQGVAAAASGVIGSLLAPSVAAINASAYENAAALQAGADAASAGYLAQASITNSSTQGASNFAQAMSEIGKTALQPSSSGRIVNNKPHWTDRVKSGRL